MPTSHWWKSLHISDWWRTLRPFARTSQDELLDEAIRLAAQSRNAVIITGPRGIRKSFCALRRVNRANFFSRKVVLIKAEKNDDGRSLAKFFLLTRPTLSQHLKRAVISILGPLGLALVLHIICLFWGKKDGKAKATSAEGEHAGAVMKQPQKNTPQLLWKQFDDKVLPETPSPISIAYTVLSILWAVYNVRRKRIIIYDDPLVAVPKQSTSTRQLQREALDSIRTRGEDCPVVILSSNEGLEACFDDRAPKLHIHMTFPYAQPTDFVTALKAAVLEVQHQNAMLTEREELKRLAKGLTEQQLKELLNKIPTRYIKGAYHMLYDILIKCIFLCS